MEHTKLDSQEQGSREGSGDEWCNYPRGSDLRDGTFLPAPAKRRLSSNTSTSKGTDDGLRSGDGHTHKGGDGEEGGRSDFSATHSQHECSRRRLESVKVKDAPLDGTSDTCTECDGTEELCEAGEDTGVPHLQGAGSHRGGIGVGDIVGTVGGR